MRFIAYRNTVWLAGFFRLIVEQLAQKNLIEFYTSVNMMVKKGYDAQWFSALAPFEAKILAHVVSLRE